MGKVHIKYFSFFIRITVVIQLITYRQQLDWLESALSEVSKQFSECAVRMQTIG
jgi:hypothetical protein